MDRSAPLVLDPGEEGCVCACAPQSPSLRVSAGVEPCQSHGTARGERSAGKFVPALRHVQLLLLYYPVVSCPSGRRASPGLPGAAARHGWPKGPAILCNVTHHANRQNAPRWLELTGTTAVPSEPVFLIRGSRYWRRAAAFLRFRSKVLPQSVRHAQAHPLAGTIIAPLISSQLHS